MRRLFAISVLIFVGCGGPKEIPDDELVGIFHDIYLTNAVAARQTVNFDSLSIYEPVFSHRGYTSEDVRHTIGNFAKRRSASISEDIVGRAMEQLQTEERVYSDRLAALDTVAVIARDRFRREVLARDEIVVRRVADTGRLRIVVPAEAGSYRVDYGYLVDSLDENTGVLRTDTYIVDSRGRRIEAETYRLGRTGHGTVSQSLTTDTAARRLVIDLNPYTARGVRRPSFTVDSLRVIHYLPEQVAFDSLQREWFDYFGRNADRGSEEKSSRRYYVLE